MIVSIADPTRCAATDPYREGWRRCDPASWGSRQPAFNQALLSGSSTDGCFRSHGRLNTEELAVVTAEHPTDPFRPQVKIVIDSSGAISRAGARQHVGSTIAANIRMVVEAV